MKYELKSMKLIMFRSKFATFLNTAKGYSSYSFSERTPLNSIARDLQH
jgi:hypothetical protein